MPRIEDELWRGAGLPRDHRWVGVEPHDASVSGDDAAVLSVSVRALPPGVYTVKWRVLSVDTHVTEGDFAFTVAGR